MKKYIVGLIMLLALLLSTITVFASEEYNIQTGSISSVYESGNSLNEEVIDILPLYPTNAFVPANINGATLFSVPKKIVVTSTTTSRGYLVLVPTYKVVNFNIYSGSRRPLGRQNWVLIGKGTAKKPENLLAV